jgi:hypothetical protein
MDRNTAAVVLACTAIFLSLLGLILSVTAR